MTLEEVIAKCDEQVKILIESMNACDLDDPVEKLLARNDAKGADEQRQLAEWLRELQERRKQPEIIRGEWIHGEDEYGMDGYHCDKCGFFVPWDNYIEDYNFCPNCGADMRGEKDG